MHLTPLPLSFPTGAGTKRKRAPGDGGRTRASVSSFSSLAVAVSGAASSGEGGASQARLALATPDGAARLAAGLADAVLIFAGGTAGAGRAGLPTDENDASAANAQPSQAPPAHGVAPTRPGDVIVMVGPLSGGAGTDPADARSAAATALARAGFPAVAGGARLVWVDTAPGPDAAAAVPSSDRLATLLASCGGGRVVPAAALIAPPDTASLDGALAGLVLGCGPATLAAGAATLGSAAAAECGPSPSGRLRFPCVPSSRPLWTCAISSSDARPARARPGQQSRTAKRS